MLRTLKELNDYTIGATNGDIGHVKDVYFDDQAWVIRYLVVNTGGWLASRKVLISPIAIGDPDLANRVLPVAITQEQVKNSPSIDTDKPVTRQHEAEYSGYYGYPYYWGGLGYWGGGMYPNMLMPGYGSLEAEQTVRQEATPVRSEAARNQADPHLRSRNEVLHYYIHARDGGIGHVQDLLVDVQTWAIRYLIVETGHWWHGHQVLIAPQRIEEVSWYDGTVSVDLTRQAVKDAPACETLASLDREAEAQLQRAPWLLDLAGGAQFAPFALQRIGSSLEARWLRSGEPERR